MPTPEGTADELAAVLPPDVGCGFVIVGIVEVEKETKDKGN